MTGNVARVGGFVAVVAERDVPGLGDPPGLARRHRAQLLVQHLHVARVDEPRLAVFAPPASSPSVPVSEAPNRSVMYRSREQGLQLLAHGCATAARRRSRRRAVADRSYCRDGRQARPRSAAPSHRRPRRAPSPARTRPAAASRAASNLRLMHDLRAEQEGGEQRVGPGAVHHRRGDHVASRRHLRRCRRRSRRRSAAAGRSGCRPPARRRRSPRAATARPWAGRSCRRYR